MCFVFIWEQTATCATYSINWLVFITEMKSVYSAVRTGALSKAVCVSSLKGEVHTHVWNITVAITYYHTRRTWSPLIFERFWELYIYFLYLHIWCSKNQGQTCFWKWHSLRSARYMDWGSIQAASYVDWRNIQGLNRWIGQVCRVLATWIGEIYRILTRWIGQVFRVLATWIGEVYRVLATWIGQVYRLLYTWIGQVYRVLTTWTGQVYRLLATWIGEVYRVSIGGLGKYAGC